MKTLLLSLLLSTPALAKCETVVIRTANRTDMREELLKYPKAKGWYKVGGAKFKDYYGFSQKMRRCR